MALYIGANYHPHDWTPERWKSDMELMRMAGFTTVRLGHLCWDSYEPEDGVYTFEWFDTVMDLCAEKHMQVVLDVTMRPAPGWVHRICPGCNISAPDGTKQASLTRYMEDVADEQYQFYALRFAEKLVNRYKNHPALFAFGLCNELGAGFLSCSEEARERFAEWLENKYYSIENLNKAWSTRWWCRRLSSFSDVVLQKNELAIGAPEAWLDMRRFFSDGIADFLKQLNDVVEKYAPGIPHSSNHYAEYASVGFDYLKYYSDFVDYPGIGFYPGYHGRESISFYITASWYMERLAETGKPMWCLEFVTGGVGIQKAAWGINRMYVFWCLIHRAEMVLGWLFRSMPNGEEQFLYGMLDHDGVPNKNFEEYVWIASDFKKLEQYGFPYLPKPQIAVADSFDSKMEAAYHPGQFRMPQDYHLAFAVKVLEKRNQDYNVVDLRTIRQPYRLLIIPGYLVMDEKSAGAVRNFVESGGTVIMTAYSAIVDETGRAFETPRPGRLEDVFGIEIRGFSRTSGLELPMQEELAIRRKPDSDREILEISRNAEQFSIDVDYYEELEVKTAECYAVETTHNLCAVSKNKYGSGNAYYIFAETDERLLGWLVDQVRKELDLSMPVITPEGVCARKICENEIFYLNMTGGDIDVPLEAAGRGVLTGKHYITNLSLKPYDGELIITT